MTIISWSQQIPTGPTYVVLVRHQLQSVELNSRPEFGPWAPCVPMAAPPSSRTCDLSSLGWKVPPERSFPCCACNPEARGMCTGRSGVWLRLMLAARPAPVHAREWTALGGYLMSTLWTCNLCTLHCQVPYHHGGGSASGLITCDCTRYFMQYLFLARTEFGPAIWDVKLSTLQITFLSAIKIITKGKSLFHVAAEDPIFNDAWLYEPSVFFQTNWKFSFLIAVFMGAY